MRDRAIYLKHAIECIKKIELYTSKGEGYFFKDVKTQDAVLRNIEVIGQCIKDYGVEELRVSSPDLPWEKIAGMRNILAHQYLGVNVRLTWEVVSNHLPQLKTVLTTLSSRGGSGSAPQKPPSFRP